MKLKGTKYDITCTNRENVLELYDKLQNCELIGRVELYQSDQIIIRYNRLGANPYIKTKLSKPILTISMEKYIKYTKEKINLEFYLELEY